MCYTAFSYITVNHLFKEVFLSASHVKKNAGNSKRIMTHNARKIKMGFQLSPGIKGCSDVVKGKLFSVPCCSLASASRSITDSYLFLHCRVTRLKKKELLARAGGLKTKGRVVAGGCDELQVPRSTGNIPKDQLSVRVGWSCGYGNGVSLPFTTRDPCFPLSLLSQSQLTAAPGDRACEAFPTFSFWEAAQYQNKLGFCFGEGISDSVVYGYML